jgi:hypothetical protein
MSFDWMSKQLYYVDNIRNSLEVIKVTEQGLVNPEQLVRRQLLTKVREPLSIAVHPWKGFLFFTEADRPARVWRCNLDGQGCIPIRNQTIGRPSGLAIDFAENRLCLGDSLLKMFACMDFDGQNWAVIPVEDPIPVAMTILGGIFLRAFLSIFGIFQIKFIMSIKGHIPFGKCQRILGAPVELCAILARRKGAFSQSKDAQWKISQ